MKITANQKMTPNPQCPKPNPQCQPSVPLCIVLIPHVYFALNEQTIDCQNKWHFWCSIAKTLAILAGIIARPASASTILRTVGVMG